MKLLIEKLERVDGAEIKHFWSEPVYVVNDTYVASSIPKDNWVPHDKNGWVFDFMIGEEAEVITREDTKMPGLMWIARKA